MAHVLTENKNRVLLIVCALFAVVFLCALTVAMLGQNASGTFSFVSTRVAQAPVEGAPLAGGKARAQAALPRKLVYTASAELIVDDLGRAEQGLEQLTKSYKGFLAHKDLGSNPGLPRSAVWTVRVPVEAFPAFMKDVETLGEVHRSRIDSEDVTEQFYDTQERIKNLKAEGESLRELLKKANSIKDTLDVREQLSKVTADLDVLEGQLKRLDNLSALSTVTLNVREKKDYVPVEPPSFGSTIGAVFVGSLRWLLAAGQWLVLAGVAVFPWLAVLALIAVPTRWLTRRSRRSPGDRAAPAGLATEPPARTPPG